MRDLWLIRHGETAWSLAGRHTGRTDVPLTPHGEAQARALAGRLAGRGFALVLTSPAERARETCRLADQAATAVADDDLLEWDYGAYEGRSTAQIREEVPGWSLWTHGVPGGESADQVAARVDRVIARALASSAPGDAALFAHAHVLRVLAARWLGLSPTGGRLFVLDPASLSVLGHEHGERVVQHWNDAPHV
jgi:broad specificity phosphatase PhoE